LDNGLTPDPAISRGFRRALSLVKRFRRVEIMTGLEEEAPANSVPAAAVRRGGQVLFGMTGRKGHVGGEKGGK